MKFGLFVLGIVVILMIFSVGAFGDEQKIKHIGIEWSTACLSLIELGDLETCGNPDLIKSAYPQPPLKPNYQKMFDDMATNPKADYQKRNILNNHIKSCIKENYCNVFDKLSNTYYWYDINADSRSYLDKIITINTNMKHTNLNIKNDEIFINATSRTLILDTNQINIQSCHTISYAPQDTKIIMDMGFIMWHILNNCTDKTQLGYLSIPYKETHDLTNISVDKSPAWLELQRLEALKAKYVENRLGTD